MLALGMLVRFRSLRFCKSFCKMTNVRAFVTNRNFLSSLSELEPDSNPSPVQHPSRPTLAMTTSSNMNLTESKINIFPQDSSFPNAWGDGRDETRLPAESCIRFQFRSFRSKQLPKFFQLLFNVQKSSISAMWNMIFLPLFNYANNFSKGSIS